jgi:hypothetical protein
MSEAKSKTLRVDEREVVLISSNDHDLTCVAADPRSGEHFRFHWACCFRSYTGQLPKVGMRAKLLSSAAGPFALQLQDLLSDARVQS